MLLSTSTNSIVVSTTNIISPPKKNFIAVSFAALSFIYVLLKFPIITTSVLHNKGMIHSFAMICFFNFLTATMQSGATTIGAVVKDRRDEATQVLRNEVKHIAGVKKVKSLDHESDESSESSSVDDSI